MFGAYVRKPVRPADLPRGLAAEWAVVPENFLLAIPDGTSFVDAAALASITVVAVQCFRTSLELMGINGGGGAGWERRLPLEGKTVFVPGALSATGSVGVQVAKNVFGASRVVSTVSTAKMPLVERLLGAGVVDELVDYKLGRKHVEDQVGRGRVDLSYNTQWDPAGVLRLTKPHSGVVVSIASVPTAETMRNVVGPIPFWVAWILGLAQLWYRWLLHGTGIKMEMILSSLDEREDLEMAGKWIAQGKVKAVTTVVDFDDIDAVRRECEKVKAGKGGLGKLVIKFQPQAP